MVSAFTKKDYWASMNYFIQHIKLSDSFGVTFYAWVYNKVCVCD